jgi:hypothetical protein
MAAGFAAGFASLGALGYGSQRMLAVSRSA